MESAANQDPVGQAIHDYFMGEEACELIKRNEGFITLSSGPDIYCIAILRIDVDNHTVRFDELLTRK